MHFTTFFLGKWPEFPHLSVTLSVFVPGVRVKCPSPIRKTAFGSNFKGMSCGTIKPQATRRWLSTTCCWTLLKFSPQVSGFSCLSQVSSSATDKQSFARGRTVFPLWRRKQQLQRRTGLVLTMAEVATYPRGKKPVGDIEKSKPRLWIYDHCPFCVRARMVLGYKGIDHDLMFLSNDDVDTPTALVGKKMVPILELGRRGSEEHEVMPESLDIVHRLDEDPAFGPPVLAPLSGRKDIDEWINFVSNAQRRLLRPRVASSPFGEFQTKSAREAYIRNHPLSDPSSYEENLKNSAKFIEELEQALWKLEPMIASDTGVSADGKLSYDDIILWPRLRGLTLVRDLGIPPKTRAYLERLSERCDIPLHDKICS